jgi:hypothetical protein
MPLMADKVEFLCSAESTCDAMPLLAALRPFSDEVCPFLNALSQALLADDDAKTYPDVITFGFFCRKANIEQLKAIYKGQLCGRLGRGVTFHIAPANVPVNFAYSLVSGLLAGNACIVRAPSGHFQQTGIICRTIQTVLERKSFRTLQDYIAIMRYERDDELTAHFSGLCDVRIIWGGDDTIQEIRRIPIPPRAFDITFADRYSICVIQAEAILGQRDLIQTAQDFYNDTYLFDQNACSSPHLVVWVGTQEAIRTVKERFWSAVYAVVEARYTVAPIIAVDKLTALCRRAIDLPGARANGMPDLLVDRIQLEKLTPHLDRYRCAGGSFLEYDDQNLDALRDIVTRKYQTLSYIGFRPEELREWVLVNGLAGIDRIMPVGRTAEFSLTWDGYDLIASLSRVCDAK